MSFRYFLIDGYECGNPGPIEGLNYFNYEGTYHNPMQGKLYISSIPDSFVIQLAQIESTANFRCDVYLYKIALCKNSF